MEKQLKIKYGILQVFNSFMQDNKDLEPLLMHITEEQLER
jgi:hypothetical protein